MAVNMLLLQLMLLAAVTPAAVALTHSTLTTDQLHTVLCECVDRRTQTLRTRNTSRRLNATHNAGRRPQRCQ